ncbi:acyl-CoA dehydrogenase [Bordetella hinzii]|uniref:Acyl-coenzyme A dehydrogenase n=1 Tax=Bordetella hinzii OH87 BAL007II TaxID=1331262 RepID=A0ABR4R6N4_9BORD|nr:Acyl-coenzyme A dehydrogenase [Bordetella hinzii]KCB26389.1 PF09317 domain protein [Bordetella hinzii OH87 BAL007II]KCB33275.1 PF09317 domain protein [Bordetella hinzii L60]KCB38981.1 PF09317 domain protein [Bordetella hinzii CA90 BAL1384]KCB40867.1 PF09317 domain protein [Bordetella hinzii 5132]KCB53116.1 PF09317 domain protein [Bordetella hinzii 1277]
MSILNILWLLLAVAAAAAVLLLALAPLRRTLLTRPVFHLYRKVLPQMSATERDALEAGTVWWEGELFRGRPDWQRLLAVPRPALTEEEQAFLDGPTARLCAMVDDWRVTEQDNDLPADVWAALKREGFFGMIIPKAYGGLGFSAFAHSEIVTRLSTRSSALAVSVMVPNSLGPAELLLHYGTDAQKDHYLPRLARGEEIPAFALTSPWAGSDAAAIPDYGIVCRGQWQGREVLGMRVTWDKRYITLAPVCTLLGLAFRLYDPDGLLGPAQDIGITCALVPHDHPGVETGRRHFPLNAMFMNGPTRGREVFMPLDFIIGGAAMAGQGWRMLMECLAAGRSISLPSSNTGMSQLTARAVGGYARVRSQFQVPVGKFEGVEEALARIGGHTYAMDAARVMTAGAIDLGERPSVVSAIVKYHVTERARQVVNDGMDIIGGKGICLGPSNFLGRAYQQLPIGITVEGANILTRSLIIFGQGAIRCHPHVLDEMRAAQNPKADEGLLAFDRAFWAHVRFVSANTLRALGGSLTAGRLNRAPGQADAAMRPYYRQLGRLSAAFALLSDSCMLLLGGSLKRRESLSARLGDVLAQMYLASAVLKRFEDQGRQAEDLPLAHWAVQDALWRAQEAFFGVLENLPNRWMAAGVRLIAFPWGRPWKRPSDRLGRQVARLLIAPGGARDRLTANCFLPADAREPVAAIEAALAATLQAEAIEARVRQLQKSGTLGANPKANVRDIATAAFEAGALGQEDHAIMQKRNALRDQVVKVDDFPFDLGRAPTA